MNKYQVFTNLKEQISSVLEYHLSMVAGPRKMQNALMHNAEAVGACGREGTRHAPANERKCALVQAAGVWASGRWRSIRLRERGARQAGGAIFIRSAGIARENCSTLPAKSIRGIY